MKLPANIPHLDWEMLLAPLELLDFSDGSPVVNTPFLPGNVRKITIRRDEDYRVRVEVLTHRPYMDDWRPPLELKDGKVEPFSIDIPHADGNTYHLVGCSYNNISSTTDFDPDGRPFRRTQVNLDIYELRVQMFGDRETEWIVDWYLNGQLPGDGWLVFPDWSEHTTIVEHRRRRRGRERMPRRIRGSLTVPLPSKDHAFVRTHGMTYVVRSVPRDLGPTWSGCLGIEYRSAWGPLPSATQRQAVAEIVSFVLGRRLLNVGSTEYYGEEMLSRWTATSPSAFSVRAVCALEPRPPAPILRRTSTDVVSDLGRLLQRLTPRYMEHQDEYRLSPAFFQYMTTREVPLGVDLPLMQSAIETVKTRYLRGARKVKAVYMEKDDFDDAFAPPLREMRDLLSRRAVQAKLRRREYKDRIMRRVCDSYRMGAAEGLELFFRSLKLPVGKLEADAMKARNSAAHGGTVRSAEEEVLLDLYRRTYYTLANRVFLRLLDHRGTYVDYTAPRPLVRKLSEVPVGTRAVDTVVSDAPPS